jgi:hypothetical protein
MDLRGRVGSKGALPHPRYARLSGGANHPSGASPSKCIIIFMEIEALPQQNCDFQFRDRRLANQEWAATVSWTVDQRLRRQCSINPSNPFRQHYAMSSLQGWNPDLAARSTHSLVLAGHGTMQKEPRRADPRESLSPILCCNDRCDHLLLLPSICFELFHCRRYPSHTHRREEIPAHLGRT